MFKPHHHPIAWAFRHLREAAQHTQLTARELRARAISGVICPLPKKNERSILHLGHFPRPTGEGPSMRAAAFSPLPVGEGQGVRSEKVERAHGHNRGSDLRPCSQAAWACREIADPAAYCGMPERLLSRGYPGAHDRSSGSLSALQDYPRNSIPRACLTIQPALAAALRNASSHSVSTASSLLALDIARHADHTWEQSSTARCGSA